MSLQTAPAAYRESSVLTASPGHLVVLLYDGARRFLYQAAVAMREEQLGRSNERLQRAEAIVDELIATLDPSAGEIAENLKQIYLFVKRHLMEARIERDPDKIEQASGLLGELRESWAQIAGP